MVTPSPLPPGFRLLCLAAQHPPPEPDRVSPLTVTIDDWAQVLRAARRHRLIPPLAILLHNPAVSGVPEWVRADLARRLRHQRVRCLQQTAEVIRLTTALAAAGIRTLTLKGVGLSTLLYGDPSRRSVGDIDLLIEPPRYSDALRLLLTLGYHLDGLALSDDSPCLDHVPVRDLTLRHPSGDHVELHQYLTHDKTLLPFDFDVLWHARQTIPTLPETVATLGPPHQVLYLVVHGAEHGWTRLRWLADLPPLLKNPAYTEALRQQAKALSLEAALDEALALCQALLCTPVEALAHHQQAAAIRHGQWLAAGPDWIGTEPAVTPPLFHPHRLRLLWRRYTLRRTWGGAWSRLKTDLIKPVDWDLFRIPTALYGLNLLLRPVGWLIRRLTVHRRR